MNRIRLFIIAISLHIAANGFTQGFRIKGQVSDVHGNALFAVNVYLKGQQGVGTTTDLNGEFILNIKGTAKLKGEQLVFSFVGFNPLAIPIDSTDFSKPVNIVLHENNQTLKEVVVEGRKSISKEFSIKEMDKMKIYLSPMSAADPLKAIAMLPSSTNTSETANPELRGSSANRSRVMLNGVPVSNPVRNSQINGIGFFSLFNPELVKSQLVYPSNPPLIYGNTSAGIVEIETEDKLEMNSYQVSAGLANSGFNLSQSINKKSFFQLYGNMMFSEGFLYVNSNHSNNLKNFYSKDMGLNYHNEISGSLSVNFFNYALSESSNVMINLFTWPDAAKSETIRDFSTFNLKYNSGKNHLSLNVGTNFSQSKFQFGNIESQKNHKSFFLSANYKRLISDNLSLQGGVSTEYGETRFNDEVPRYYYAMSPTSPAYHVDTSLTARIPEAYLYFRWNPVRNLIWGVGIRKDVEVFSGKNLEYISYQTNLRYNLSKFQSLILSLGEYNNTDDPTYFQKELRLLKATHYSLEYLFEKKTTIINLAAYYKKESGDLEGGKRIMGAEIYIEHFLLKNLKASISNTLFDSEVEFDGKIYNSENNVGYFLTTTISYYNSKLFNMAASWSNRQGKLYTPVAGSHYNAAINFYEPIYSSSMNTLRFKHYNTVNLSVSRVFSFEKKNLVAFVSISNLLDTRNQKSIVYSRDYTQSQTEYYQKRSVYFGCALMFN